MAKQNDLSYKMTLRLKKGEIFFGPGVLDVLNLVNKNGSLSQAAKEMGMSYNKAWRIVQKAERLWGKKLIVSKIGGLQGGGSQLTQEGKKLVKKYESFEKEANQKVKQLFNEIFLTEKKQ
ncbi:molybdenum transporter [Tetragenococcus halophilus subsp. flandriensis]|uniref:winged helix-turn-helix domain-containing protein n=1 Tax=Tetragenococcus halophilus TaxID=51669 RepID=UPI0023EA1CD4|nr:LysR family transcriptional regulator [Tetragenococcus halophilus]GMA07323.1 molybdenum transporter [Tetragenococcus halophilus subsp. flandriensis]